METVTTHHGKAYHLPKMNKVKLGEVSNIFTSNQSVGFRSKMNIESSKSPVENSSKDFRMAQEKLQYLSTHSPVGQLQHMNINQNSEEPGSSVMQG